MILIDCIVYPLSLIVYIRKCPSARILSVWNAVGFTWNRGEYGNARDVFAVK